MVTGFVAKLLDSVNRFSRFVQRKVQGIPRGSSYIYSLIASKILKPIYANVADEVKSKVRIWRESFRCWMRDREPHSKYS